MDEWQLIDCERFGVEPDGPSSRWSLPVAETLYYAQKYIAELETKVERWRETFDCDDPADALTTSGVVEKEMGRRMREINQLKAEVERLRKALQVIIDRGACNYHRGSVWYERIAKAALGVEPPKVEKPLPKRRRPDRY